MRLLDEDDVRVAADSAPDMESDEWNAYAGTRWWQMIEQLDATPYPVYYLDLDTRRGRLTSLVALVCALSVAWATCLLLYAGALWIAGLLQ